MTVNNSSRAQYTAHIHVTVTPRQREKLERLAAAREESVSLYLRRAIQNMREVK